MEAAKVVWAPKRWGSRESREGGRKGARRVREKLEGDHSLSEKRPKRVEKGRAGGKKCVLAPKEVISPGVGGCLAQELGGQRLGERDEKEISLGGRDRERPRKKE